MRTILAILLLVALPALGQDLSITQTWNPKGTQNNVIWLSDGAAGTSEVMAIPAKHVIVKFSSPGEPISCPPVAPPVIRNKDGTYSRPSVTMVTLQLCHSKPREWHEFWTDYPDKGGKFIGEWKKADK